MSDGGQKVQYIKDKWKVDLSYQYISTSFRNNLKSIHNRLNGQIFCAFPTMTDWDGVFFDCIWTNDFEFYKYSDEAIGAGFTGKIKLVETSI
jgi:hypothetical protein